ncbi:Alcohol dehydrogenase transcription factor Myb/SANT-like [Popillia japonica]|uniref:Alcohol dehydrogenase transcription factor Myb/SANT-like n=1 Tax=Popillia japonica TaxID=7064 RepID=A0AAW1KK01_POPJA
MVESTSSISDSETSFNELPIVEDEPSNESEREVLRNFIEQYENFPELWNASHPHYMNKNKRNLALEKMLESYKAIKPNATREDVRKKINSLRTNYRKEVKKIIKSKRSGIGTDNVYEPSSWVFHCLKFLKVTETPASVSISDNVNQTSLGVETTSTLETTKVLSKFIDKSIVNTIDRVRLGSIDTGLIGLLSIRILSIFLIV